jgi:hypothetical protein
MGEGIQAKSSPPIDMVLLMNLRKRSSSKIALYPPAPQKD